MARWLGLDLGGTNIKAVVLEDGAVGPPVVVGRASTPTLAGDGPSKVVDRLVAAGRNALERWGPVVAGGVGVPGVFDAEHGTIELFPNLPGPWAGQAVAAPLAAGLGVPIVMINDARGFTLAEARMGAAAGSSTVVALVLGTGIGGGVVVDGALHFGRDGRAGEIAHQVLEVDGPPCGCGNRGCLEALASTGALAEMAARATAEAAFAAAESGDATAVAAVTAVVDHLGHALANLVTVLIPERIVIGGGMAEAGPALLDAIAASVRRQCVLVPGDWYEVVPAVLGVYAGAIGAAVWAADCCSP